MPGVPPSIGGLLGVLVTLVPSGARVGATVGIREVRAVIIAGALAIAAAAWIARPLGDLAIQPQVSGQVTDVGLRRVCIID